MASGTIYLVCAVAGALNTANAYRPFSRRGALSMLSLASGMLTSELPLPTIAWQVIATAAFAVAGAFATVTGGVGLAISLVSWVALVGLHRDAQRSRIVLEDALQHALGADYVVTIRNRLREDDDRPLTWRQIAIPDRGARKRYLSAHDLAYGDAGVRNHLDIWRRPDLPLDAAAPVLVQLHGGAWTYGKKDQAGPLLTHLAERGWVCVAINYRVSPKAVWPAHIVDVKRAIAWVRANIADHGGDPSFIAVTGGSAGGHLSALAALSPGDRAFQSGFEDADTTVQAAVPMYGLYDLTNRTGGTRPDTVKFLAKKVLQSTLADDRERWEAASPLCRVRADAPPFFVVHGTNDSFLPVEQARAFVAEMAATSAAPVAFAELPRTQHAFDFFSSVRVHHTVRAVERFLVYAHEHRHDARPLAGD